MRQKFTPAKNLLPGAGLTSPGGPPSVVAPPVPELVDAVLVGPLLVMPAVPVEEDAFVTEVAAPPMPLVVVVLPPPVLAPTPWELEHAATQGSAVAKTTADRVGRGCRMRMGLASWADGISIRGAG
jgi:hypothetical protein